MTDSRGFSPHSMYRKRGVQLAQYQLIRVSPTLPGYYSRPFSPCKGQIRQFPQKRRMASIVKVRSRSALGSPAVLAWYPAEASTCFSAFQLGGLSSLNYVRKRGKSCPLYGNPSQNIRMRYSVTGKLCRMDGPPRHYDLIKIPQGS